MALPYVYLLAVMNMDYYHPEDPGHVNVYISGYEDTTLEYWLPWETDASNVYLDESNDRTWESTIYLGAGDQAAAVAKGIRVTSSHPITIQVSRGKRRYANAVAYTALQLSEDSKSFLISSQRHSTIGLYDGHRLFIIGAGSEGADVSVYDNKTTTPSLLFVEHLSSYEMLEVPFGNGDIPEDITGLYLRADRPIVVYSGHQCGNIPIDVRYCDPLLQQVPPLPLVGTEYIMGPIMQRGDVGYTARVIVTQARTDIVLSIESGTVTLSHTNRCRRCTLRRIGDSPTYKVRCRYPLRVGQYLEFHVTPATSPLAVNCSSPCYVYQMNHGGDEQAIEVNTDPFMALVPPLGRFSTITRFSTTSSFADHAVLVFRNFVSVIAPRGQKMLLDGELLSADESLSVGEYVAYYKEIQQGFHQVQTQDGVATRIAVQVYGHSPSYCSAYGVPADYFGHNVQL